MVGPAARQDDGALGLPDLVEVTAGELRRGVDRVGAPAREEDLAVRHRRQSRQAVGQVEHRAGREVAEHVVGVQLLELCRRCLRDLGTPVADVRVPEARRRVEVAPARLVPDVAALAPVDDELVTVDDAHVRKSVPEVRHAGRLPGRRSALPDYRAPFGLARAGALSTPGEGGLTPRQVGTT